MMGVAHPVLRPAGAVLFDLDGTLIDSAPDLGAAANQLRRVRGLAELPLTDYRHLAGSGARGMLAVAFGITPEHADFGLLKEECFRQYEQCMEQRTTAFDGVAALISGLVSRRLAWGVVTNKSARFAVPLTNAMPVFASAAAIVCGDTTGYTNPHPEPLLEAARRLGVEPGCCIYVGDDERDVIAGRAAGMQTVAANYGYLGAVAETSLWGADAAIDFPLQLLTLLAND